MHAIGTRLVGRGTDHAAVQVCGPVAGWCATDDHREPAQLGASQLFDGCIEGVEVEMDDRALGHVHARRHPESAAGVLPPFIDVRLTHVARANHQLHVWNCEMRCGASQHPRRWIVLVLVDALIEVDLIQIAQKGKPVQGNPPLRAPFFDVLLELHAYSEYRPMFRSAPGNSRSAAITASASPVPLHPPLRMSTARMPAACAPAMSAASLSPTMTVHAASVPS